MTRTHHLLIALLSTIALVASACGGGSESATDEIIDSIDEPTATTEAPTTTPETEAPTTAPETTEAQSSDAIDAVELYESGCARCHGTFGDGTSRGPELIGIAATVPDKSVSADQIANGGRGMPSFGSRWSEEEIQAVVDYIYENF